MWIARDKDEDLYLYTLKPIKGNNHFVCSSFNSECMEIDSDLFPGVTWENSPKEVKLELVKTLINEKENIVKILKTYDNIFGLSDGGIARSDEDIEYAADVILKSLKESNL